MDNIPNPDRNMLSIYSDRQHLSYDGIFVDQYNALGLAVFLIMIQAHGWNKYCHNGLAKHSNATAVCPISGPKTEILNTSSIGSIHTPTTADKKFAIFILTLFAIPIHSKS